MSTGRLETFADGVFAIAATLLVLNVDAAVGERTESLGRDLVDAWPAYVGYVVSFVTIGIIWVNHHTVLSLVERADRPFLFANVVFLMCVAFIPFPTRLIAERLGAPGERAAALAYGITLTATAIMFSVVWFSASIGRRLLRDDADPQVVSGITRSYLPGPWIYLAATLVAIVSPAVSAILYGAIALFYVIESSFFGKTGTRKASAGKRSLRVDAGVASAPCRAGERVLVHERVMDDCVARLSAATRERIALGDPFDDEGTNYWESHLPFGGRAGSSSGVGRVGGRFSMERLTELKTIVIDLG